MASRGSRLTGKQREALMEIRQEGHSAVGIRTLESLLRRGLIKHTDWPGIYRAVPLNERAATLPDQDRSDT